MRGSGRWMLAAAVFGALLTAAVLAFGTASAPAGNRTPSPTLTAFPGPSEVTYGQNVAYSATLPNSQSSSFTHVQFHNPIPTTTAGTQTLQATLAYSSCAGQLTATEWVCNEITVGSGQTARVTIVWKTPSAGESTAGCACMVNNSYWTIKEGTGKPGSAGPDTFPSPAALTSLLVVPDPVEAGGYGLTACTDPTTQSTLTTNLTLGPANPFATKVCASTVPGLVLDPGLAVEIDENNNANTGTGIPYRSDVCIPAPGFSCADIGYTPWLFSPRATLGFVIDNSTLDGGEKVDKVFHDGVDVTADCTINVVNGPGPIKITNVACLTAVNGSWNVG
jgi:hypothetical protein